MRSYVWKIDDGATHWVLGTTKDAALGVWREAVANTGEIPADVSEISIDEVPSEEYIKINLDDDAVIIHTAREWWAIYHGTNHGYLACSEW